MKKIVTSSLGFVLLFTVLFPPVAGAQRRTVVVRRPVRTRPVIHRGYPLRRALPRTVVVRPARRVITVGAPLVYLPPVTWTRTVTVLPAGERLVWQDSEVIERDEDWVDTNFGIDNSGNALMLDISDATKLNFAEVTFANGNVQVVDFNEQTNHSGLYKLLDFADGRHVKTVRVLAKAESDKSKLTVYLSK